jgi:predicted Zn-dependent peptidase
VGGYINAYTSREMTAYYARCPVGRRAAGAGRDFRHRAEPGVRPDDIETERHVILQEIGQAADTPDDIIFDWLHEVLPRPGLRPHHPWPGGILRRRFWRGRSARLYRAHYGPDRMILSAAGGVDHDAIVAQAEAIFGALPPVGPRRPTPPASSAANGAR